MDETENAHNNKNPTRSRSSYSNGISIPKAYASVYLNDPFLAEDFNDLKEEFLLSSLKQQDSPAEEIFVSDYVDVILSSFASVSTNPQTSMGEAFSYSSHKALKVMSSDLEDNPLLASLAAKVDFDLATSLSRKAVSSIEPNASSKVKEKAAKLLVDDFLALTKNSGGKAARRRTKLRNSRWVKPEDLSEMSKSKKSEDRLKKKYMLKKRENESSPVSSKKEQSSQISENNKLKNHLASKLPILSRNKKKPSQTELELAPRAESKGKGYRRMLPTNLLGIPDFSISPSTSPFPSAPSSPTSTAPYPDFQQDLRPSRSQKRAGIIPPRSSSRSDIRPDMRRSESAPPPQNSAPSTSPDSAPWVPERRPTAGPQHLEQILRKEMKREELDLEFEKLTRNGFPPKTSWSSSKDGVVRSPVDVESLPIMTPLSSSVKHTFALDRLQLVLDECEEMIVTLDD
ncbi:hypothetical protein HK096_008725, partial [Nowakowskiella sp. JEL0078]